MINTNDRKINNKLKDEFKYDEILKDAFIMLLFKYAYENINESYIEQPEDVKQSIVEYRRK